MSEQCKIEIDDNTSQCVATMEIIDRLYRRYLRRDPDNGGINEYLTLPVSDVVKNIVVSEEYIRLIEPYIAAGIAPEVISRYFTMANNQRGRQSRSITHQLHPYIIDALSNPACNFIGPEIKSNRYCLGLSSWGRASLDLAIASLLNQRHIDGTPFIFDIIISIPEGCLISSERLHEIEMMSHRITIVQCADWGPITKLTALLEHIREPSALLFLADDDVIYPDTHFSVLAAHALALGPNVAVGTSGFTWQGEIRRFSERHFVGSSYGEAEGHLQQVDIIETWCGVCLRRNWFSDDFLRMAKSLSIIQPDLMRTDDTVYSIYLDQIGVIKININHELCNRYDSGHDVASLELIKTTNINDDPLNGHGVISMQWVRCAAHILEIQNFVFTYCEAPKPLSRVVVVTVIVGDRYAARVQAGRRSRAAYCQARGYAYREVRESLDPNLPLIWTKMLAIRDALNDGYDCVFYADADTIIANPTISIEAIADRAKAPIIFTYDLNGINAGSLLVKNTPAAREVINEICDMTDYHYNEPWYEQAAFVMYIRRNAEKSHLFAGRPQREFNAYVYCWHHNDFIVHLAGIYGPAVQVVMDTVYDIVYKHRRITNSSAFLLRPYFFDYKPDSNAEYHLTPKANGIGGDVYLAANGGFDIKPIFVCIFSDDARFSQQIERAIYNSGTASVLPGGGHNLDDTARFLSGWKPHGSHVFVMCGEDPTRGDEIRRRLEPFGDVRFVMSSRVIRRDYRALTHSDLHRERSLYILSG